MKKASDLILKVLNLDGVPDSRGDTFDPSGFVGVADTAVPVKFEFKDAPECAMGTAILEQRPDGVYAKCTINSDFPNEALLALTPAVGGIVYERGSTNAAGYGNIKKFKIESLGFSMSANQDPRIGSVSKQIEDLSNQNTKTISNAFCMFPEILTNE